MGNKRHQDLRLSSQKPLKLMWKMLGEPKVLVSRCTRARALGEKLSSEAEPGLILQVLESSFILVGCDSSRPPV